MVIDPGLLFDAAGALPLHGGATGSRSIPGHPFFGAMFLFIGSLLAVEQLAGPVWRRHRVLVMLWPAVLLVSGFGMLLVVDVQPDERSLHLTLAVLLIAGAYSEFQYRGGRISRYTADAFAIPALIIGGFVIGPMHPNGPVLYSTMAQLHWLVGIVAWGLAAIKLAEVRLLSAETPSMSVQTSLDYAFATGVMALGMSLLMVQQFHHAH